MTFRTRRDAALAKRLKWGITDPDWTMRQAPAVDDILWPNLMVSPESNKASKLLGEAGMLLMFLLGIPIVSSFNLETLSVVKVTESICHASPFLGSLAMCKGQLAALVMELFVSYMPMALALVIGYTSRLAFKSDQEMKLQFVYFEFMVVFSMVVYMPFISFAHGVTDGTVGFRMFLRLMTEALPLATCFFFNFMLLQWSSHAITLTRFQNLLRFWRLQKQFDEDDAIFWSEQDEGYNGMGGRTARLNIQLGLVMVWGVCSPLLYVLGIVNFAISWLFQGYLMFYAERRKPDTGGYFWDVQLKQANAILVPFYLMSLLLLTRATSWLPLLVALPAGLMMLSQYSQYSKDFGEWNEPPLDQLLEPDDERFGPVLARPPVSSDTYEQPELMASP